MMDLDLNRLSGIASTQASKPETLRFDVRPNSFFTILVLNDVLRGPESGTVGLVSTNSRILPAPLNASSNHLVIEKLPSGEPFDLVVRDERTGFVFFNIEGNLYDYDSSRRLLDIKGGRLLMSVELARKLGRPSEAGSNVGSISVTTKMFPIEVRKVTNSVTQSSVLPRNPNAPALVTGPDLIVGDVPSMQQFGDSGTQVGLALSTIACNRGSQDVNWIGYGHTTHPVVPQNFYRMSGGSNNNDRFEQIGQSWLKHGVEAVQENFCGFGCVPAATMFTLGAGCSDTYFAPQNGEQDGLGSRAWVNPFTGSFPATAIDHTGHTHSGTSHRLLVESSDLNTSTNVGATYYAESQYITADEYNWCQSHPADCNMYNNASYRRFNVTGTASPFSFMPVGSTVQMTAAINAWTGATINSIEPAPAVDGRAFIGYKVTNPSAGVWHYEYALYNENLDRAIQSFTVPLGCGITVSNLGFHAPLNHPGFANDGTAGNAGFSNAAWTTNQTASALTWSSETFAQNENANALRFATLYNFRFDSNRPPQVVDATIGFFKTGSPISVGIQAPAPDSCNQLQIISAVSRMTHGGAGNFDIDLPLSGASGVECRNGSGNHAIIVSFSNTVVSGNANLTSGVGSISGSPSFNNNKITINLAGVADVQKITVTLTDVTDSFAHVMPSTAVSMNMLIGDTNGNKTVNASDVGQTKAQSARPVTTANFREDVTPNGAINASDIIQVKANTGRSVP